MNAKGAKPKMNKKSAFAIIAAIIVIAAFFLLKGSLSGRRVEAEPPVETPASEPKTDKEPEKITATVKLYFASADAMTFKTEEKTIEAKTEADIPAEVIKALIVGPETANSYPTLNRASQVLGVEVKNKTADVQLGDNFIELNTGGSTKEFLSAFSIVNSLCELEGIDAVTFSYGGIPVYEFGSFYFDEPCTKKMSVNEL